MRKTLKIPKYVYTGLLSLSGVSVLRCDIWFTVPSAVNFCDVIVCNIKLETKLSAFVSL